MELTHLELRKILPQAYPFMMIDRVVDIKKGKSLTAIKNITANEWPFLSNLNHFPETLLIEAATQAALVLYHQSKVMGTGKMPKYLLGRVSLDIRRLVQFGNNLKIIAKANKMLERGGYSTIRVLDKETQMIAQIEIFYSVRWHIDDITERNTKVKGSF